MSRDQSTSRPHDPLLSDSRVYVAGVGIAHDSPGPLREFLAAAGDVTDVAFVVVPYGTPTRTPAPADVLNEHSALPVCLASDGEPIAAGVVYLAPYGAQIGSVDGRAVLMVTRASEEAPFRPLDALLVSIAEYCGDRSVAVLLAGDVEDGAAGLRAVSLAGGLVLIQSPETADTTPPSVIAERIADASLAPAELPAALQQIILEGAASPPAKDDGASLEAIFNTLRGRWGVDFASYKPTTIRRGILRRITSQGAQTIEEYVARMGTDPDEIDRLYRDLLIRVTEFFRTPEAFRMLEDRVLPEIFHGHQGKAEIRAWVAGCATGEEAYSVAMLLHEQAHKRGFVGKITIFATDVHRPSLSFASQGIYPAERLTNVSADRRIGYFQELADGSYKVAAELRKMIVFAPQSVISDPPFTRIDLVCCRNLLIYLRPPLQEKVVTAMHFALHNGGFLFLGVSEGLGRLTGEFVVVDGRLKIFRKARDLKLPLDLAPRELTISTTEPPAPLTIARPLVGVERQLLYDYDRLLERYMPTGVLLDEQRRPLHYFGGVARYMQQPHGRAETDFLRMVESSFGLVISNGIQRAAVATQPIMMRGIRVLTPDGERYVDITFERLGESRAQVVHTIITFAEIDLRPAQLEPTETPALTVAPFNVDSEWQQRIEDLEHELSYTRENLQATIEELQTSNEEIQATNEELLAANEELQSVNEGLQSLNEELQSVNAEFELKNSELKELNRDYDDLIRSTRVAILSLDRELRIRRYSPSIDTFFDLQPFDLGRPITNIAYKLEGHTTLIEDLQQILSGGDQVERPVGTPDGRWFQLRARPILNEQQVRVGVVLMYIDISELKHAQDLAMRSEQRLRGAIESSLDAFYLFESVRNLRGEVIDFQVVEVNQVGADRLGTPRDALPGRRIREVIDSPALASEIISSYRNVVESGDAVSHERLTDLGHESRWFRQQVVKVSDGVAITSADITDRKRYEAEREAQHLRLELALEGGGLGTWESNLRTGEMKNDQRALLILGLNPDTVEESREYWRSRIHPDDLPRVNATLEAYLSGKTPAFDLEVRIHHEDNTWRWLLTRGRVVERDAQGAPIRLAGTYMDITERVRAEERLRASERRYQTLSETSPVGIYRADALGNVTYVNPRWCEIVGVPAEAAMDLGWQRYLHPDDRELMTKHWGNVIAARRESQIEFRYLRPDGETRWVLGQVAPEFDARGELTSYVGTLIDISRRIAAEDRLRQQSALLEAANQDLARAARLKDQFLANMSHELRTPLTGVLGFSEALNQGIYGEINPAQQRAVQHIFDNGQHLLSLINDILDLARIGAGQVDLKLGPVIVDDVCVEAIDLIGPIMKAKAQRFTYTRPSVGLMIEADVLRLRQILINLLSNAVKFTPEGGELGMEVVHDDTVGVVRFIVWDHGIGIAPAQQPLLFQPFVQLDNRLAREQAGTGLGLALVRQLTSLHGGSINLRSVPGEGSAFTIAMPQRTRPTTVERIPPWSSAATPTSASSPEKMLILLAEDDPSVAALLLDYLGAQGYEARHVSHGDDVLPQIRSLRPQLALIDIQLPGMSGLEIIARLRADSNQAIARTPIIAVTALAMVGDRERCLAAGADDYLSKPIRLDDLSTIIARARTAPRG